MGLLGETHAREPHGDEGQRVEGGAVPAGEVEDVCPEPEGVADAGVGLLEAPGRVCSDGRTRRYAASVDVTAGSRERGAEVGAGGRGQRREGGRRNGPRVRPKTGYKLKRE